MARNAKALVRVPHRRRGNAGGAQTSLSRAVAGGRFLGFRGFFLRLRRRLRHLDAIHLHEPAALEVIDAGPWAAWIAQDRGAIAIGIPAELDAVRRTGAVYHLAFGHAEAYALDRRGRVSAGRRRTGGLTASGR